MSDLDRQIAADPRHPASGAVAAVIDMQERNRLAVHDIKGVIGHLRNRAYLNRRDGIRVTPEQLEHWALCLELTTEKMQTDLKEDE